MKEKLEKLQEMIGYQFKDPGLLTHALTHSSYANEKHWDKTRCNERLEFLGDAVLEVMKFIYENIIYAELNTKSDYCQVCGWDGEIQIAEENGKLIWKCPQCGNTDQDKMNVARRTCGYIGTQFWNQGRTQEIRDRVLHL